MGLGGSEDVEKKEGGETMKELMAKLGKEIREKRHERKIKNISAAFDALEKEYNKPLWKKAWQWIWRKS